MNNVDTTHDQRSGVVKRRDFIRMAVASGMATTVSELPAKETPKSSPKVCTYTEHFQKLPIPQVCKVFKQIGVDGLDLTVRPGGHIDPKNVKEELPQAVKAAREQSLEIMMLTTGITAPDRQAEEIVATCQKLGIDRIKLGYFPVGKFGNLAKRLDEARRQLDAIVKLTTKYDVRPCVHVHSGNTIPSNGFMLHQLIREMPPDRIGAYLDSYHMTITGGNGGWRQAIDLLRPWISLVALKNFQWERGDRDDIGQQRWRTNYCRLEDGIAPIPEFVRTIHETGYRGFYTLHTEYRRSVADCIKLTKDDFVFWRKVFARLS
ncbi:MAG: sugar phosphate isomerase/epimerase [Planctomycetaceae bacterium]|nr:sugar phosphate isomerase/epimerase [Planctomycetaceae bacterium]